MTISEHTLKSSDAEPVRRFEVFTGAGRRGIGPTAARPGSLGRATSLTLQ